MNHLLRELAPFGTDGWTMLDDEARDRLVPALTARKVVDFAGPYGWKHSAVDLGRTEQVAVPGLAARRRRLLPLSEVRAEFTVALAELVDFSRGATDIDLTDLDEAVLRLAAFENRVVLEGWAAGGVVGVRQASTTSQSHDSTPESFRVAVTSAVATLRDAGVGGPYVLAAGPADWAEIVESDDGGYPLRKQLEQILGGRVERASGIEESVLLSTRGGDFELTIGEDLALGYRSHDAEQVHLYVEESLTFRVNTPEAAVAITRAL